MRALRRSRDRYVVRLRSFAALIAAIALVAGCQSPGTSSAPSGRSPTASTPAPGSAAPTAAPTATPTARPSSVAAHWEPAGTMAMARQAPHAVLLGDGRVLVVGDENGWYDVDDDSARAELWDAATGSWRTTEGLNKPRDGFVALPLAEGRALVTGGINQDQQSYSSTYIYDPEGETWTKSGLLGTARTGPAATVLRDGRVLVVGGYYHVKPPEDAMSVPEAALAAFGAGPLPGGPSSTPPPADVDVPNVGAALATAELFDPATGEWSATGSMTYARFGADAVTLDDGRILIVGSLFGYGHGVTVDERAYDSAEIWDPATGRFSLAGRLPDLDTAALEQQAAPGANPPPSNDRLTLEIGSLVALDDGGAVLIGREGVAEYKGMSGAATRSFRFDADSRTWTEIGRTFAAAFEPGEVPFVTLGVPSMAGAMAARLPDGRVLVAGGAGEMIHYAKYVDQTNTSDAVEAYDPTSGTWSSLPAMPQPRAGGATVSLPDGSVLLVGGYDEQYQHDRTSLASAVRFLPSR
jgi:Galactose oxidase, central domain/Kelch motif